MPTKKTTPSQAAYIREYNREHITYRKMSLNSENEQDQRIAAWIDAQTESTSAYLKRLVVEDMERRQGGRKA